MYGRRFTTAAIILIIWKLEEEEEAGKPTLCLNCERWATKFQYGLSPNIVARWVVIACDEGVTTVTFDDGASNLTCCIPNNLSVVGAVFPRAASIIYIVIPLLFIHPCTNSLRRVPTSAIPPEYVFSEGA